jgi:hypothetical protein
LFMLVSNATQARARTFRLSGYLNKKTKEHAFHVM